MRLVTDHDALLIGSVCGGLFLGVSGYPGWDKSPKCENHFNVQVHMYVWN